GGEAVAATLAGMPKRATYLICGMLNTKDIGGYLRPLAPHVTRLHAVSIPGEKATLPAAETEAAARDAGMAAVSSASVAEALAAIAAEDTAARVLICGSLYLAGTVLRENG
ncbi:bifunctional folylpolyglutamate synthase/dihydrofolate synthase, partial [Cereibacter changlensis JA139]